MGAAALFIRRTDAPDWDNAFINFDYRDLYVAPNYQVTDLWYDHFSRYLLAHTGDTGELNVVTTMSEDGRMVIVKVVNPTAQPYRLTMQGAWPASTDASYQYFAPGSLTIGNTMEQKDAVTLKTRSVTPSDNQSYILDVEPYSAGVLEISRQ